MKEWEEKRCLGATQTERSKGLGRKEGDSSEGSFTRRKQQV